MDRIFSSETESEDFDFGDSVIDPPLCPAASEPIVLWNTVKVKKSCQMMAISRMSLIGSEFDISINQSILIDV